MFLVFLVVFLLPKNKQQLINYKMKLMITSIKRLSIKQSIIWLTMLMLSITILSGCVSKNANQNSINSNLFCRGAKPFYSLLEPFEEIASDEMIDIIYLHDLKYDCLCLNKKEACNEDIENNN
jgi:hypothetical protein